MQEHSSNTHFIWEQKEDIDFLRTYLNFTNEQKNAEVAVSVRVFDMALKHNDPARGRIAATAFKKYVATLVAQLKAEADFDIKVFGLSNDATETQITGNGAFAIAFKRVYNAMWYGGDLKVLGTVSACQKFAREEGKKEEEKRTKDQLYEQIALDVATQPEWIGKDTTNNNPEFRQAVTREYTRLIEQQERSKKDVDDKDRNVGDIWDDRAAYLATMLRAIYSKSPNDATDMYETFEGKCERTYEHLFGERMEEAVRKEALSA